MKWELGREAQVLWEILYQCHFVHQKSHMIWPGFEPWPPRWETDDLLPELWHSQNTEIWLLLYSNVTKFVWGPWSTNAFVCGYTCAQSRCNTRGAYSERPSPRLVEEERKFSNTKGGLGTKKNVAIESQLYTKLRISLLARASNNLLLRYASHRCSMQRKLHPWYCNPCISVMWTTHVIVFTWCCYW
jgi:hypothetical protein